MMLWCHQYYWWAWELASWKADGGPEKIQGTEVSCIALHCLMGSLPLWIFCRCHNKLKMLLFKKWTKIIHVWHNDCCESSSSKTNMEITYKIEKKSSRCNPLFLHYFYNFHARPDFRWLLKASLFQLRGAFMNPPQKAPSLIAKSNKHNSQSFFFFWKIRQTLSIHWKNITPDLNWKTSCKKERKKILLLLDL